MGCLQLDRGRAGWTCSLLTLVLRTPQNSSLLLCEVHGNVFTKIFPGLATPAFLPCSQDKSCAPAVKLVHSPLPEYTLRLPASGPCLSQSLPLKTQLTGSAP